jgi:hypothetical protein
VTATHTDHSSAFAGPILPPIACPAGAHRAPDAFVSSVLAPALGAMDCAFAWVIDAATRACDLAIVARFEALLDSSRLAVTAATLNSAINTRHLAHESGLPILSDRPARTAEQRRRDEINRSARTLGINRRSLAQREQDAARMHEWRASEQPGAVVFNMGASQ